MRLAIATFVLFGLVDCGTFLDWSTDAGPRPDAATLSAAQSSCASWATGYCANYEACDPVDFATQFSGTADCLSVEAAMCAAMILAPAANVTPDNRTACGMARMSFSCSDFANGQTPTACVQPAGVSANGTACRFNAECASSFCQIQQGASCGVCTQTSSGSACPCSSGFSCMNSVCAGQGQLGDNCSATLPCANSNHIACVIPAGQSMGTCTLRVASAGAACGANNSSAPGCDYYAGLFCNTGTNVCGPYVFVGAGQSCGTLPTGGRSICNDGTCINQVNGVGTCVTRARGGQSCDPTGVTGPSCQLDAQCVAGFTRTVGTCQLRGGLACAMGNGSNECTGVNSCETCASLPGCGWCHGICMPGSASGSSDQTCFGAVWDWVGGTCGT